MMFKQTPQLSEDTVLLLQMPLKEAQPIIPNIIYKNKNLELYVTENQTSEPFVSDAGSEQGHPDLVYCPD